MNLDYFSLITWFLYLCAANGQIADDQCWKHADVTCRVSEDSHIGWPACQI